MSMESNNGAKQRRPPKQRDARTLPHNLAIEASILGGIILNNALLAELRDLEIDDFYH